MKLKLRMWCNLQLQILLGKNLFPSRYHVALLNVVKEGTSLKSAFHTIVELPNLEEGRSLKSLFHTIVELPKDQFYPKASAENFLEWSKQRSLY